MGENVREGRPTDGGGTSLYWQQGNTAYSARVEAGQVQAIHVLLQQGLFTRQWTMQEISTCFGDPEYAHAVWIPFEVSYTHYTLWYPEQGILFQGKQATSKSQLATPLDSAPFEQYILFRPSSLMDAAAIGYPHHTTTQHERLLTIIQPWQGSGAGLQVHEE